MPFKKTTIIETVILTKLLSLAASLVVKMTTLGATNDQNDDTFRVSDIMILN